MNHKTDNECMDHTDVKSGRIIAIIHKKTTKKLSRLSFSCIFSQIKIDKRIVEKQNLSSITHPYAIHTHKTYVNLRNTNEDIFIKPERFLSFH